MISLQTFAHTIMVQLLCHVQKIVVIGLFEFKRKQYDLGVTFELW